MFLVGNHQREPGESAERVTAESDKAKIVFKKIYKKGKLILPFVPV